MKVVRHDPPIQYTFDVTVYRKWWQFWKPKSWVEREVHVFYTVIDCEGKSIEEVMKEFER